MQLICAPTAGLAAGSGGAFTAGQPHIKDVARAAKRIADAAIDLARFVAP